MRVNAEQLKLAVDSSLPLYVLIDPLVGEPVAGIGAAQPDSDVQWQRRQAWGRQITAVELVRTVALPRQCHPYLVSLDGPDDPWLALTLRMADEECAAAQAGGLNGRGGAVHHIAGWLQSDAGSQKLAELVSSMCRVNTRDVTQARYLRLADRRVLDFIGYVVGARRLVSQFGPLQRWVYLDSMAQLQCLQTDGNDIQPLLLAADEWQRIARSEAIHRTIGKYLGELGGTRAAPAQALYPAAERATLQAADAARRWSHRFVGLDDATTFAALLLRYPSLTSTPAVQALLEAREACPEPLRYLHPELVELARSANAKIVNR